MTSFIELTNTDNKKILLNKDWIIKIQPEDNNSTKIYIGLPSLRRNNSEITSTFQLIYVKESYDSLKSLLIDR